MAMQQSVSIVFDNVKEPPKCPHGPTLLFKRTIGTEESLYYACSASRDRKGCHFYFDANQEFDESKKKLWKMEAERILPKIDHRKLYVKFMKLLQSKIDRVYCHDCNELLSSNDAKAHSEHELSAYLSDYDLTHPSQIMKPIENPKKEAQYLFSKESTRILVSALENIGCKHILCIGAPRIHEYIQSECSDDINSLLLDIDHRYHNFFGPLHFCWYNVFNNYYFNKDTGAQVVNDFLQQDNGLGIAIVIDPPFGGRVEPLAHTLQLINKQYRSLNCNINSDIKVVWTYPYYLEQHVLDSLPDYKMLDYKVDYDNHPLFMKGGRKYGSPVRIFTNIVPCEFPLPENEGYRFCKPCKRWVSKENKHCKKCSSCTSKDGRTYVHCDVCKKCVKPTWSHCEVCKRCCLKEHNCDDFLKSSICFNCGQFGHKKIDCDSNTRKRKLGKRGKNIASKKQKVNGTAEQAGELPKVSRTVQNSVGKKANKIKKNNTEEKVVQKSENEEMQRIKKRKPVEEKEGRKKKSGKLNSDPSMGKILKSKKIRVRNKMKRKLDVNV